ncbi:MAG: M1 family metallopeptidase [Nitrospiraceae bacterium]
MDGRVAWLVTILWLPLAAAADTSAGSASAGPSDGRTVELLSHELAVTLIPARHQILATDRITLKALTAQFQQVSFSLNRALRVTRIQQRRGADLLPLAFTVQAPGPRPEGMGEREASLSGEEEQVQWVTVRVDAPAGSDRTLTMDWSYEGVIHDPPREPRHLRFVTPSETAGHIGSEGVYLSGETHWYPDVLGARPIYLVRVTTPDGWEAVTQGRQRHKQVSGTSGDRSVTADWEVAGRTEALTLVANRFVKASREWHPPAGDRIEVAAYLFPDDAHLADEYLEASVRYLEAYTKLLGPYPFPKFAVVENFFASGLGMPSFTLLGSGVVKRHYVQPFALGHEIVHSWLGNWVFNDPGTGNWAEGLTTYLANYYYDELTGKAEQAREQRRMMLLGYAVYVRPDTDYPVGRFRRKSDQKDNAIGYQKAAMVFHMLRREIGDEAFWAGLRKLVADYGGSSAAWGDLERVFTETGGRDLRWFFAQWVEGAGAPSLSIAEAVTSGDGLPGGAVTLRVRLAQVGAAYRLRLPLAVKAEGGTVHATIVAMDSADQVFTLSVPGRPLSLQVDPDFETFRRLAREQLPPMLNLFVTDRERSVVPPAGGTEAERAPYQDLVARLASEKGGQDPGQKPVSVQATDQDAAAARGSVLILGGPGVNRAADWAARGCGNAVSLGRDRFTVDGRSYEGPGMALLLSCRHADRPDRVVTLFYGLTPPAAAKVARLLFFYGWQSYLVFRDGAVVARGDFPPSQEEMEVRFDAPQG